MLAPTLTFEELSSYDSMTDAKFDNLYQKSKQEILHNTDPTFL